MEAKNSHQTKTKSSKFQEFMESPQKTLKPHQTKRISSIEKLENTKVDN